METSILNNTSLNSLTSKTNNISSFNDKTILPFDSKCVHPLKFLKTSTRIRMSTEKSNPIQKKTSLTSPRTLSDSMGSARTRRMKKLKVVKEKREEERIKKEAEYPEWAKNVTEAAEGDEELKEILGEALGNPSAMKEKVEEELYKRSKKLIQEKKGSSIPMKVEIREFDKVDAYIWLELYETPSQENLETLSSVFRAWYLLGKLGAYNASNLQVSKFVVGRAPLYNNEQTLKLMPSSFHNIGNIEFQDNLGRVWVDFGTADPLSVDLLINALINLSSDHFGIKRLIIAGEKMGDWEQGMARKEDGYLCQEI